MAHPLDEFFRTSSMQCAVIQHEYSKGILKSSDGATFDYDRQYRKQAALLTHNGSSKKEKMPH